MIKLFYGFMVLTSFSGVAKADMVFKKINNRSIVLQIKNDNTARIFKKNGKHEENLIDGTIHGENSSLIIAREEGDVCPSVSVELFHDIALGENSLAKVRNLTEDEGTAAPKYCSGALVMDGSYTRVK